MTRFRALSTKGLAPRFEIGLHVVNPNRTPLLVYGLSYRVRIEGHTILSGVSKNLPVIDSYGEQDLAVQVTADLLNSLRLISDLSQQPRQSFDYEVVAKLDVGSFLPKIKVKKQGIISLRSLIR
ncbi:MAG: LEA type 2 family protein [Desulfuromonas sp.]|nr:LEA type 2 family protein [Desulfuromonas sp.]